MNPLQHLDLAARYDRTLNLRSAITQAVVPGARVLDAGCGIGLLSFWALQAGAAEVTAVDIDGIDVAYDLAKENGLADSIEFATGDLWSLDLPERRNAFDVILAMIYLNDPRRDERQSQLAHSINERYLAAGGKMIPDRVRYLARACDWPSQDHTTRLSGIAARIGDLEARYGFRFRTLAEKVASSPWKPFFPSRWPDGRLELDSGRILSDPTPFVEIDYRGLRTRYPAAFEVTITAPGILNTILWTQELWFEDHLLFSNESVSWVAEPFLVEERSHCTVYISDTWRRLNVLTAIP